MAETRPDPTANPTPVPDGTPECPPRRIDPSRDGLVGIYALRILDRGVEPRTLVAAHHATRYGQSGRPIRPMAMVEQPPIVAVGRAAATAGRAAMSRSAAPAQTPATMRTRPRRLALPSAAGLAGLLFGQQPAPARPARRLVTAGFAIAAVLGLGALGAAAEEQSAAPATVVSVRHP